MATESEATGPVVNPELVGGTPIKWAVLEKDLQEHFGTDAKFGEHRSATKFGENQGYVSQIFLAEFDWQSGGDLPKKAIVKITETENLRYICEHVFKTDYDVMRQQVIKIHNNEYNMYKMMRDDWKCDQQLKMPALYCGREYGRDEVEAGYLALEFVDNAIPRHMYHNVQPDSCEDVLRIIAAMGSHSLKHQETVEKLKNEFVMDMFKDVFDLEKTKAGLPVLVGMFPELASDQEFIESKMEAFVGMDSYYKVLNETCPVKMLVHGDLWSANILWEQDKDGIYRIKKLIDWQISYAGNPVADLNRFLNAALDGEEKVRERERLFKVYYDALVNECQGEVDIPFTLEMLNEGYERLLPVLTFSVLPAFANLGAMVLQTVPESERGAADKNMKGKMWTQIKESVEYLRKWY
ncbi:unnamed protein product, partial [Mesorhabditis spiculigera]